MAKKLLMLDLDETLVHTRLLPRDTITQDPSKHYFKDEYDNYEIILRPHFKHFLIEASKYYTIGVWSANARRYINLIISLFPDDFKPVFVLDSTRCIVKVITMCNEFSSETITIKPLKKIWRLKNSVYNRSNTVVVDNTSSTFVRNYGNAIRIKDFIGQDDDSELLRILELLIRVANKEDVRDGGVQQGRLDLIATSRICI